MYNNAVIMIAQLVKSLIEVCCRSLFKYLGHISANGELYERGK